MTEMKVICSCGQVLTSHHEESGVLYFACPNNDHKDRVSCLFLVDDKHREAIAEDWLFDQFNDEDWTKKKALEWFNKVWANFRQYLWDNR
jgi:hypothetical protein